MKSTFNFLKFVILAFILISASLSCKKGPSDAAYDTLVESTSTLTVTFVPEVGLIRSQTIVKQPLTINPVFLGGSGNFILRLGGTGSVLTASGSVNAGFGCYMPITGDITKGTYLNTPKEACGLNNPIDFRAGSLSVTSTSSNIESTWLGLLKGSCGNTVDGYSKIIITDTYTRNYQWGKVKYADGTIEARFLGNMNDALIIGSFTGAEFK